MHTPTRKILSLLVFVAALGLLASCGGKDSSSGSNEADDDHDHSAPHGGVIVESSDHKAHFELVHDAGAKKVTMYVLDGKMAYRGIGDAPVLNLTGPDGSVKVTGTMGADKGETAAAEWFFTHDLLSGEPEGRFRVKIGSATYTPELIYGDDDHGHEHDADDDHDHHDVGPHDGMVAKFTCPTGETGYVELKLHDDKGDLELWIASDEKITKPYDLPIDSEITVTFTEPKATSVTLRARNKDKNEDEDGTANNRDGNTNYFIFPGDSGQDPKWLMGTGFEGHVTISWSKGDTKFESVAFELIPHTHGAGGHDHDDDHEDDDDDDK